MKCIWCLDDACNGSVKQVEILGRGAVHGVCIPVCEKHLEYHKALMILIYRGYNIEDLLNMPAKSWQELAKEKQDESE